MCVYIYINIYVDNLRYRFDIVVLIFSISNT